MPPALLKIKKLSCLRGDNLLFKKLQFQVSEKQLLRIAGANGSGKTSLLRIICGLTEAENGQILWRSKVISQSESFQHELGYIGHKDGLKNQLTAFENIAFYQQLHASQANTIISEEQLDKCLHKLNILHCADRAVYKLSFGQRRRLAFARLLVSDKKLWVLDEPFTGIDVQGKKLIESICIEHLKNNGLIVMTNHGSLKGTALNKFCTKVSL